MTSILSRLSFPWSSSSYSLAIAGGGCKAFYGLGAGLSFRKWGLNLSQISGVSAGAAMALCILSEREEESITYFEELARRNSKNFRFLNLLRGLSPFPHENITRRSIRYSLDLKKIKESSVKVFIGAVKAKPIHKVDGRKTSVSRLISRTMQAYIQDERDKQKGKIPNRVQSIFDEWSLENVIYSEKDLVEPKTVEQILLNSSSVPPVVSLQKKNDEFFLDGGLTNNLLLEYFSPSLPKIGIYYEENTIVGKSDQTMKNTYLFKPSRPIGISSFDYTNPVGVRKAFELGKEDAEDRKSEILDFIQKVR